MSRPKRNSGSKLKPANQRLALRRSSGGRGRKSSGGLKRASRWLFMLLSAGYVLAIIWTSLGYASEDRTPTNDAESPVAIPMAGVRVHSIAHSLPFFWTTPTPAPTHTAVAFSPAARAGVRGYVQTAARTGGVDPRVAEWIVSHESQHQPLATGDGGQSRGLWQINRYWHPEVSDRCAYDVRCSTHWSIQRIRDGYANEWSTWKYRHSWFGAYPPPPND